MIKCMPGVAWQIDISRDRHQWICFSIAWGFTATLLGEDGEDRLMAILVEIA
jgi:hypothetical protein